MWTLEIDYNQSLAWAQANWMWLVPVVWYVLAYVVVRLLPVRWFREKRAIDQWAGEVTWNRFWLWLISPPAALAYLVLFLVFWLLFRLLRLFFGGDPPKEMPT